MRAADRASRIKWVTTRRSLGASAISPYPTLLRFAAFSALSLLRVIHVPGTY